LCFSLKRAWRWSLLTVGLMSIFIPTLRLQKMQLFGSCDKLICL
jgi:hypothetical protein